MSAGARAFAIALVAFQSFHVAEHAAQTWQKYALRDPHATGLLGHLVHSDWLHFAPNALLFGAVVAIARTPGARLSPRALQRAAIGLAGWHLAEHMVKLVQSQILSMRPSPGIVGAVVPLIPLHLAYNAAILALLVPLAWHEVTRRNRGVPSPEARMVHPNARLGVHLYESDAGPSRFRPRPPA